MPLSDNQRAAQTRYRERHPELVAAKYKRWADKPKSKTANAARRKRYQETHREEIAAAYKIYRLKHKERLNAYQQAHRYGLTIAQYAEMVANQEGKCAICQDTPKRLHVDHDHTTGKVRSLLCGHCNSGLGRFYDQPGLLETARLYLLQHGA